MKDYFNLQDGWISCPNLGDFISMVKELKRDTYFDGVVYFDENKNPVAVKYDNGNLQFNPAWHINRKQKIPIPVLKKTLLLPFTVDELSDMTSEIMGHSDSPCNLDGCTSMMERAIKVYEAHGFSFRESNKLNSREFKQAANIGRGMRSGVTFIGEAKDLFCKNCGKSGLLHRLHDSACPDERKENIGSPYHHINKFRQHDEPLKSFSAKE